MRFIDVQCRPVFCSTGQLSFEVYVQISPIAFGNGAVLGITIVDEERHIPILSPSHKSLKDYILFFDKEVKPLLLDSDFSSQQEVDSALFNLSQQNDIPSTFFSAISIAIIKAASLNEGLPLYSYLQKSLFPHCRQSSLIPIFNILDATCALYKSQHTVPFLLLPSSKLNLMESLRMASRVLAKARELCWQKKKDKSTAPQGGILTHLNSCEEGFSIVIEAASQCGYRADKDFTLGIDFESEYFKTSEGVMFPWSEEPLSPEEQLSHLLRWSEEFPLSYVEDPFVSNETDIWRALLKRVSRPMILVGDKFFSTILARETILREKDSINSFVLKPNNFPTVTAAWNTLNAGLDLGWTSIVSHRSIDSDDTFLSHFAVASGSQYMKAGGMCNMEHIGKYNELLRIFNEHHS
jgi:enolase